MKEYLTIWHLQENMVEGAVHVAMFLRVKQLQLCSQNKLLCGLGTLLCTGLLEAQHILAHQPAILFCVKYLMTGALWESFFLSSFGLLPL